MDSTNHRFFAPCPRGLEPVLGDELRELGAQQVAITAGGAEFEGSWAVCYRANLESRIASRILWRLGETPYRTEADIYQAAHRLRWHAWFPARRTIKIKVSAQDCPLKSLDFVTLRVKDAICDCFRISAGRRPDVDTRNPDVRVAVFLDRNRCTFYLDTSGEPLFKRGWRQESADAPLRENLAAGILRLAGWPHYQVLFDPMCGAGTFPIEAAWMAQRIPPGGKRRFAFEKLLNFDERAWRSLRDSGIARQLPSCPVPIYAADRDKRALESAEANLKTAGVSGSVQLSHGEVLDQQPPAPAGLLISNPSYGHRVGEAELLAMFYPRLGDWLKQRFAGWTAYFFTGDARFPKLLRLSPSKRTPLFNGALECRLYEFRILSGSHRRPHRMKPD
ncbi:THUMP domain-containing class I SAM-dependent RNA methyltransferase [Nitrospira sp. Nam80]